MKNQYKKFYRRGYGDEFYYVNVNSGYHRRIHTFGEIKAFISAKDNEDLRDLKVFPRAGRNSHSLDAWNDPPISRNYKKSWKDYTKHRKQWMRTPMPIFERWDRQPRYRKPQSETGLPPL